MWTASTRRPPGRRNTDRDSLPLHVFGSNGESPTYTRRGVPDSPLRLSDTPAAIAGVAALVELNRAVGDTWTVYLDEGWV